MWDVILDFVLFIAMIVVLWAALFVAARTIFIAYFQAKSAFLMGLFKPRKENSNGKSE